MQPDRCSSSAWTILPSNTQARLALPLLCAIVLAGVLLCQSGDERQQSYRQKTAACSQLPGLAGQLCSSYHSAVGEDKFTAAAHWRQLSSESCKKGLYCRLCFFCASTAATYCSRSWRLPLTASEGDCHPLSQYPGAYASDVSNLE